MMSDDGMAGATPAAGTARLGRRTAARLAAVQASYELALMDTDVEDVIIDYLHNRPGAALGGDDYVAFDPDLFADVVRGVSRRQAEIAPRLQAALTPSWPLERLETILRAVLQCGCYELLMRPDVPVRVVINEYLEVAHAFFAGDEPALVNAVLDRIAREARGEELARGGAGRRAD